MRLFRSVPILATLVPLLLGPLALSAQQDPLTFMDVQELKRGSSWTPSPDGAWMLYTVSTPDWLEAESQTDIHVVSLSEGVSSSRQLTFTDDKNERQPAWGPGGSYFVFASDRDSDGGGDDDQLYVMRHDGGEARKITDAEEGVSGFSFSPGGAWLVYTLVTVAASFYIPVYLFIAMRRVYGQGRAVTFLKYVPLTISYLVGLTLMMLGAVLIAVFSI